MARTVTKYSIFIGSPSDLQEERIAIEEVIKELNLTYGVKQNIIIELLKWETHSAPGISTNHPQTLITNDIGEDYDIFIGILWTKFGTPTENAGSGTEEEYQNAVNRFEEDNNSLQILFYFKDLAPKSLKDINPTELIKIDEFKKSLPPKKILYWEYDTCENLKNFLRLHIPRRITNLVESQTGIVKTNQVPNTESDNDFGLLDYSEMFEELINDSTKSLTKIAEDTGWIGTEMTKKADEVTRISKLPNVNNNILKGLFIRTAKLMNDYSKRLEIEIPIYYSSFEKAIKAGINLINLTDDFINEETISNLEESKSSMMVLRVAIPPTLESMNSYYESVKALPRIQKDINSAKRILMAQLEDLIEKLEKSLNLAEEFSNEIGSKIDKLNLTKEK